MSALSRADAMLLEQEGYDTRGKSGRSSKNKNRNRKKPRPLGKEITYFQALQHLCGGYYKVRIFKYFIFLILVTYSILLENKFTKFYDQVLIIVVNLGFIVLNF